MSGPVGRRQCRPYAKLILLAVFASGGLSTKASSSAASKHVLFKEARLAAITDIVDSYTRGEPFSVDLQALVRQ